MSKVIRIDHSKSVEFWAFERARFWKQSLLIVAVCCGIVAVMSGLTILCDLLSAVRP